jgi:cell wall assembly regulator SMI1
MKIKYRTIAPPATSQDILYVESQLGIKLPIDYVLFMEVQNGGSVDFGNRFLYDLPEAYPDPPLMLEGFLPIEELVQKHDSMKNIFGFNLLPVGVDNFGNYVCLGLVGDQKDAIYFVDHELIDEETDLNLVVRVSNSFSDFVSKLTSDNEQD